MKGAKTEAVLTYKTGNGGLEADQQMLNAMNDPTPQFCDEGQWGGGVPDRWR